MLQMIERTACSVFCHASKDAGIRIGNMPKMGIKSDSRSKSYVSDAVPMVIDAFRTGVRRCSDAVEVKRKLDGAQDPKRLHDLDHQGRRAPGTQASRKDYRLCVPCGPKDTFAEQKQSKHACVFFLFFIFLGGGAREFE